MKLTSYLVFNGEAEKAAEFYADLLGGRVAELYRYADLPPVEGMPPVPAENRSWVMHGRVDFEGGSVGLADSLPDDPRDFGGGGHVITIHCDSVAQAEAVYAKLTPGAWKIACKLGETFYAKRYAEVVDRYGVLWAVIYEEQA